jgi:hypothetical protein
LLATLCAATALALATQPQPAPAGIAAQAAAAPSDQPTAQVALDWNANAVAAVRAAHTQIDGPSRVLYQTEGLIYLGYVQAAVYDAVTKITGRYAPYHDFAAGPIGASPQAAVVAAAYRTLVAYLGDPDGTLAAKYQASLAALPDAGKAQGIAIGQAAAADIVALRAHDGRGAATKTYGAIGPVTAGAWQVVPPSTVAQTPWVAFMQPFMLSRASQFRPGPPPLLSSPEFARDLTETRLYGAKDSTVRTPEQTATAYFWNVNVIDAYNKALRDAASQSAMDLVDTVHLLAMGDLVTSDAGMACFDAKYHYLFWRPYTAIRNANLIGNSEITPDPTWLPLVNTPNHPEYPSAHGCLTSALAEVLANALHTRHISIDFPGATNGGSTITAFRHYDTVQEMERELVNARVWIGFHYRTSVDVGIKLGTDVARWELQRYFTPVPSASPGPDSFTVTFAGPAAGEGRVYFGSGPGCQGLVEVGTQDRTPGSLIHSVTVTGNDLPGSIGDNGIQPGTTYWYEMATVTRHGERIDNNNGQCYSVTTLPKSGSAADTGVV